MNFDIYAMGKTRNKSNKSRGHKDCCFSAVEGQPINEASEQQLPPRPELIDDFVMNDGHDDVEEVTSGGSTQRKSRGNHSDV